MRRTILLAALVLAVLAGTAGAEPRPRKAKKPGVALGLSYGLTLGSLFVGPIVLLATKRPEGLLVGAGAMAVAPSAGHFYAGESGRAWKSTAVRGVGLLAAGFGGFFLLQQAAHHSDSGIPDEVALGTLVAGGVLYAGATLHDWIDAPRAARRTNARNLSLAPTPISARDGVAPGLSLVGSF